MTDELLKKLDELIAVTKQPAIPLSVDLWDYATIASYLKLSATHVSQRLAPLPDFPKAIRVAGGQPRYKAAEIIAWAESYQEGKRARPGPRRAA